MHRAWMCPFLTILVLSQTGHQCVTLVTILAQEGLLEGGTSS
jgi:hypothetical protein